jgi:preprotein translocase subunit SecD
MSWGRAVRGAVGLAAVLVLAGCGTPVAGRADAGATAAPAQLRLRAVLRVREAQPGAAGQSTGADRQSTDPAVQDRVLGSMACPTTDPLRDADDPAAPLITCSQDRKEVYLLGPSVLDGAAVRSASAVNGPSGWTVQLEFTDAAGQTWAEFTGAHVGEQAAFTLDTRVLSAPTIQEAITGGSTQIAGVFTEQQAQELASSLRR